MLFVRLKQRDWDNRDTCICGKMSNFAAGKQKIIRYEENQGNRWAAPADGGTGRGTGRAFSDALRL